MSRGRPPTIIPPAAPPGRQPAIPGRPPGPRRKSGSKRKKQKSLVACWIACAISTCVIIAGGAYLWLSPGSQAPRHAAATNDEPGAPGSMRDAHPAPTGNTAPVTMPEATFETDALGVRYARLDIPRIAAWCRAHDLPAPPDVARTEPAIAETLLRLLPKAAETPDAATYGDLGQLCDVLGCDPSAIAYYRRAADAAPGDFRWPYRLGNVYMRTGALDRAATAFADAQRINPEYEATHARLGRLNLDAGRLDEAQRRFLTYVELRPDDHVGYVGLGWVAEANGRLADAIEQFTEALRRRPDSAICHYALFRSHILQRNGPSAARHLRLYESLPKFDLLMQRDPVLDERWEVTACTAGKVRAFDRARFGNDAAKVESLLRDIVARRPDDALMLANLATALRMTNNYDEAETLLQRAISQSPDLITPRVRLAELYLTQRKAEQALDVANAVLKRDPVEAAAHNVRGRSLFLLERYEEAVKAMKVTVSLSPDSVEDTFFLAEVMRVMGRRNEAIRYFKRVLALYPAHAEARQRLDTLAAESAQADAGR